MLYSPRTTELYVLPFTATFGCTRTLPEVPSTKRLDFTFAPVVFTVKTSAVPPTPTVTSPSDVAMFTLDVPFAISA